QVTYNVTGFIEKNNDLLFRDLSQAMWAARHALLRSLFPEGDPQKVSLKLPPTAGFQFKSSVALLMKNLYSKNPNYIRCIKPNDTKSAMVFTPELVLAQVRYLGLMENVRVRRAGYAFRQLYGPFLQRYKMLNPRTWPRWDGGDRYGAGTDPEGQGAAKGTEVLLAGLAFPAEELAFGHTKIFIRSPRTVSLGRGESGGSKLNLGSRRLLRELKSQCRRQAAATTIAAHWRGYQVTGAARPPATSVLLSLSGLSVCLPAPLLPTLSGWSHCPLHWGQMGTGGCGGCGGRGDTLVFGGAGGDTQLSSPLALSPQARRTYRRYFRSSASTCLANFIYRRLVQRYLVGLAKNLPPLSVMDRTWPPAPYRFLDEANQELKNIFYRWKCKKYWEQLPPSRRAQLQAKLCASELFKDKKTLYPKSLQQPFRGEYLGLKQNPRYQKLHAVAKDKLVMADTVRKVNRASGKTVPRLLLLTTEHLVLADPKAAQPKTVLSLSDIRGVSVTRFSDGFLALHLKEVPGEGGSRGAPGVASRAEPLLAPQDSTGGAKGAFLLVSAHLIELVTRLHQTLEATTGQALPLHITD
ncbi:MYO1A protein, partial [Chaetops frenatus]|nr:MYO1A protein [Chaetops frenatus]